MTSYALGAVHDIESAKQVLAHLIERSFESASARRDQRRAIRLEVPIEPVDLLGWLRLQGNRSRGYFANRDQEFVIAGRGNADVITAEVDTDYEELFARLRAGIAGVHPNLRYYGGMRFSHRSTVDEKWKPFRAYRFVLPRFELLNRGAQSYLACNAVFDRDADAWALKDELLEELDTMAFPSEGPRGAVPRPTSRVDLPDQAQWSARVQTALDRIVQGPLEKVVLARETRFTFEQTLDALSVFTPLLEGTQHTYQFCYQPRSDFAFFGASPERLYKRRGRFIESEAVAGTRPRGTTEAEDEALGNELLANDKEQREHRYVVDSIRQDLEKVCKVVHVEPEPSLLKLRKVQHLYTRIEGILRDDREIDAELLGILHPTPAVGGYPREEATAWIDATEPFDRGWYSGPVGWVSQDAAEFAVGIRSGLVDGNTLSLYSGAGIVSGSKPVEEWAEIEQKMANFLGILTGA